jgi:glycosyltransferase involved in cell wall biosynthesis
LANGLGASGWGSAVAAPRAVLESGLAEAADSAIAYDGEPAGTLARLTGSGGLGSALRDCDARLVHACDAATVAPAARAARRAALPMVASLAAAAEWDGEAAPDRLIVPTEAVADALVARLPDSAARVRVVPAGVDPVRFDPSAVAPSRIAALVEQWELSDATRKILVPGRLGSGGGHLGLIRALPRVRPDFACLFVGGIETGSSYLRQVEALLGTSGLAGRVRLIGPCADMPAAYALVDLVVVPASEARPFERAAAEAQAMGKPVIITDLGNAADCVLPAVTGWLVPPDSPAELAEAIELALAMPAAVRDRVAARARQFALRELNVARTVRRTLQVYRELLPDAPGLPDGDAPLG